MDRETQRQLGGMAQLVEQLGKRTLALEQSRREIAAEKMAEALSKFIATTYDKAAAYTNLMLIAGYASFFALLAATKPLLHDRTTVLGTLLMVISIATFVLFEVFKMTKHARFFLRHKNLLDDPVARKSPEAFQAKLNELDSLQRTEDRRFFRAWVVVIFICVSTGLGAIGLLTCNYILLLVG